MTTGGGGVSQFLIENESAPRLIQSLFCNIHEEVTLLYHIEYFYESLIFFYFLRVLGQNYQLQNYSLHKSNERKWSPNLQLWLRSGLKMPRSWR